MACRPDDILALYCIIRDKKTRSGPQIAREMEQLGRPLCRKTIARIW